MPPLTPDEWFMRQALQLAAKGRGFTSPNPMVGAVVVQDGAIVGRGYHERVGGPHAEVNALRHAGHRAAGATLYVTLEPCNHYGRTPPCTLAILQAGIARVVVGMADPNLRVAGGGSEHLRAQGLQVTTGALEKPCRKLNQAFIKQATTGIPYVTIKTAATLDGRIATSSGDARWISNERSRRFVHRLRCDLDAILVGSATALTDDPQLTARLGAKHCRQPKRIVLDSQLRLPVTSQLVRTAQQAPLWVACHADTPRERRRPLEEAGVEIIDLPGADTGLDLEALLRELGKRHLTSLLVEGGGHVIGGFVEKGLADDFYFFYAPKNLADPEAIPMVSGKARDTMSEALPAFNLQVRRFGEDIMVYGRLREQLY
jgi:diaminohydroxyphosphoribosylaminopyrimidine deaminase/5-amino-6-(5-phosphoribosylamino)uracil reductase